MASDRDPYEAPAIESRESVREPLNGTMGGSDGQLGLIWRRTEEGEAHAE